MPPTCASSQLGASGSSPEPDVPDYYPLPVPQVLSPAMVLEHEVDLLSALASRGTVFFFGDIL